MSSRQLPPVFGAPKPIIGMIHVGALPGTPASRHTVSELEAQAVAECKRYRDGGIHAETTAFPLTQGIDVYAKLKAGQISGRAVLIPA